MKTATIIHGTPSEEEYLEPLGASQSNKHWIPWLQHQLIINGYHTWTPEMPQPHQPNYELWRQEFERYTLNEQSLLVGHSCGGGFLLRWLSENPIKVARTILVAPWLDPQQRKDPDFFDFKLESALAERTNLHIFSSTNDAEDIDISISMIKAACPATQHSIFEGYGHFCLADLRSERFPELLATLLAN